MDQKELVNKLRQALINFDSENSGYKLLMLMKEDLSSDGWVLIMSAKWLDEQNLKQTLEKILKLIKDNLSEESKFISYVLPLRSSDQFVVNIASSFGVGRGGTANISNCSFNNTHIASGIIFESNINN